MSEHRIVLTVNGRRCERMVEGRVSLVDFLRNDLGLTGTHAGCEHGVCGACTVLVDGDSTRGCLMLAAQAHGRAVQTIEGVANADGSLSAIQRKLAEHHGLQCGFCTPGVVMTLIELARESAGTVLTEAQVRTALAGNLCRCTGYQGMVDAALALLGSGSLSPPHLEGPVKAEETP
ncbi:MAG: (2Fe-2S)-binding protein [Betaproteobacteria bacterium]|nr:(2Fe-2S)-binding protein [Betaproteobacteria bacterium]